MKHALRKYLSPCGSALFMVVSTMAALIVMVTAMYMSVLSSRQVQYATFDHEQTYVTSTSLSDMVYSYITNDILTTNGSDPVVSAMLSLNKGESVSTNGNDFKAFGGVNDDDERIGAYDVTLTYVYDVDGAPTFDIAVTVERNGVFETTHDFIIIEGDPQDINMRRIDNFFTSTGYLPSDIWITKVVSDSKMYFDNEYVKMTEHNWGNASADVEYNFDIVALGSLDIDVGNSLSNANKPDVPMEWMIGKDFTLSKNDFNIDLAGTSAKHGRLIVGRDFYLSSATQNNLSSYTDVYVLGNAYLDATLNVQGNLYVKGNLVARNLPSSSNIYVNGSATDTNGNTRSYGKWDVGNIPTELDQALSPSQWPAWSVQGGTDIINVSFDSNNVCYIDKDGQLSEGWVFNGANNHAIVIDTGENETDVRTITLSNNASIFVTENGETKEKKFFTWDPTSEDRTYVITVGKGSLVLNVPEDVVYQENTGVFIGNIGWFAALGGTIESNGKHDNKFSLDMNAPGNFMTTVNNNGYLIGANDVKMWDPSLPDAQNISNGCCDYVPVTSTITINGKTETRSHYTCVKHGGWYDIDNKETGKCSEIESYHEGKCDSLCIGRIDEVAFDSYYGNAGSSAKSQLINFYKNFYGLSDSSAAKYIYPNVNIFLASDSENAQIYFGGSEYNYNSNVSRTVYFGYIYAPYMTFAFSADGAENGALRAMGGLVVSDIILKSGTGYMYAQPDISIPGLVGENWKALKSLSDKTWRISHGGT